MSMEVDKTDGLDLAQLMDQIRSDAEKRKRNALSNGASVFYRQLLTQAFDVLLPSAARQTESLVPDLKLQPEFERREQYHVNDLLGFHDEQFIRNAYRAILKREPDDHGLPQYLGNLRSGRYSKIDILTSLRFSPEGERANVPIEGLSKASAFRKLYRVPVLGYLLQLPVAILRLPVLIENHRRLESHTAAQLERVVSHINEAVAYISDLEHRRSELTRKRLQIFQDHLDDLKSAIRSQIDSLVDGTHRLSPDQMKTQTDHLLDSLYCTLEEEFRGTRDEIKTEVKMYLPVLARAGITTGILDVGCGRGEWLEVLKEAGLQAKGIDHNRIHIQRCKSLSLDVVESDALAYLRSLPGASLNAVTAFHFAEHLPLETLVTFLDEVGRTLKPGGLLILETPNPENLVVGSCNFYLDPTHKNPIPSRTMKVLVEARGFRCEEIIKLHAVPSPIEVTDRLSSDVSHFIYGPMNYAMVARKPDTQ
jgi:O-antigen chain-terminating methyltransferase